jgi:hypothetical protein
MHTNAAVQSRSLNAVRRLREIALAEVSPYLLEVLSEIGAIMNR